MTTIGRNLACETCQVQ